MTMQFTAGTFVVDGFLNNTAAAGTVNTSYAFNVGTFINADTTETGGDSTVFTNTNFLWTGANQEVTVTGGSGHSWSLHVQIKATTNTLGTEEVFDHGNPSDGTASGDGFGAIDGSLNEGAGVTFNGTGGGSLASLFHSLAINLVNGADQFSVTFTLTDITAASGTTWTQYFATPCYATGTRIAVPAGEIAVEDLRIGDLVMTASGIAKKVKWLGRRNYTAAVAAANAHVRPVIVRKDAIAAGMPHRDLMVSPNHALFIDDAFVQAATLVNGVSILRSDELAPVAYIHIEMAEHDVVFAEGLPAETFVDDASRQMFDNADEFHDLYGADQGVTSFSANRLEEGVQLEALRRRIATRAGVAAPATSAGSLIGNVERIEDGVLHGWVVDVTTNAAVELEVVADGEVVGIVVANRYRVDLDHHGIAGGCAGFTLALPASVDSLSQVSVRRMTDGLRIGGRVAAMAD